MFRVGQKVVCVDDVWRVSWKKKGWFMRFRPFKTLAHSLTKHEIYTVTGLLQLRCDASGIMFACVFVAEGRHLFGHSDIPFPAFQFRPLVSKQTDISALKALLNLSPQVAREAVILDTLADVYRGAV